MARLLLLGALVAFVSGAVAQPIGGSYFPYCNCDEACGPIIDNYVATSVDISFNIKPNPACLQWSDSKCSQDVRKLEINTYLNCRFSTVNATFKGQPTNVVFDGEGQPGVQVIKLIRVAFTLAQLVTDKVYPVTLHIGTTPGNKKCTSIPALLNTTDAALYTPPSPISIAVFNTDLRCCAVLPPYFPPPPSPLPPPPPPPPSPIVLPPPPPPPPACEACYTFSVVLPGPGVHSSYNPLQASDCQKLAGYLMTTGCATAPLADLSFSCKVSPFLTTIDGTSVSQMSVCAMGGPETSAWQAGWTDACAAAVDAFLGYNFCDTYDMISSSCGASSSFYTACQAPTADFPHSCFPGNSLGNGGYQDGLALGGTYYQVTNLTAVASNFSFSLVRQPACTPVKPKQGNQPPTCCDMVPEKLEFVINKACYGMVKGLYINGVAIATSYNNNTYIDMPASLPPGYPAVQGWYQVFKVGKLNSFTGDIKVTVVLRPGQCSTAANFLPGGLLWYAFFNGVAYNDNCCATSAISL